MVESLTKAHARWLATLFLVSTYALALVNDTAADLFKNSWGAIVAIGAAIYSPSVIGDLAMRWAQKSALEYNRPFEEAGPNGIGAGPSEL